MVPSFTVLKMIAPSPASLPGVPTLADLQKRAEELTASLPSYSSAPASTAPALTPATGLARAKTDNTTSPTWKPIPKVNIHPVSSTSSIPLVQSNPAPGSGGAGQRSWRSTVGLGLGSWTSPPPTYRAQDPIALNNIQLREEMEMDQRADEDQGRAGLLNLSRGERGLQGGIPGEEGRMDRWGSVSGKKRQMIIGDAPSGGQRQIRSKGWLSWFKCGV